MKQKYMLKTYTFLKKLMTIAIHYYFILFTFLSLAAYLEVKSEVKVLSFMYEIPQYIGFDTGMDCSELNMKHSDKSITIQELSFRLGSSDCVINALAGKEKLIVHLSPGGLISEARHLYQYLNKNDIHIHLESVCLSACVELLARTNKNSVSEYLFLADHQGKVELPSSFLLLPFEAIFQWVDVEMKVKAVIPRSEVISRVKTKELTQIPNSEIVPLGYAKETIKSLQTSFQTSN